MERDALCVHPLSEDDQRQLSEGTKGLQINLLLLAPLTSKDAITNPGFVRAPRFLINLPITGSWLSLFCLVSLLGKGMRGSCALSSHSTNIKICL